MIGRRINYLLVLKDTGKRSTCGCKIWECLCHCENTHEVNTNRLNTGATKSCGCLTGMRGVPCIIAQSELAEVVGISGSSHCTKFRRKYNLPYSYKTYNFVGYTEDDVLVWKRWHEEYKEEKEKNRVDLVCVWCDKEFWEYKSHLIKKREGGKSSKRQFCSMSCMYDSIHRSKRIECICNQCEKIFWVRPSRVLFDTNYCSRACHAKWKYENKNPYSKLSKAMGGAIVKSLKLGAKGGRHWETLVDFTLEQLKERLESLFVGGMSWENYGRPDGVGSGWVVDHIKAVSLFHYKTPEDEDFKKCWCLDNLQPLWDLDNIKKGNK